MIHQPLSSRSCWWQPRLVVLLAFVILAYTLFVQLALRAPERISASEVLSDPTDVRLEPEDAAVQQRKLFSSICSVPQYGQDNKRVLVTGAAGFIGFHVTRRLQNENDVVVGLDNFNTYYPVSLKRARQAELRKYGVHIVDGDINDQNLLDHLFKACQFTHVVHLAAQAGVRYAARNPMSYINSNVAGTVMLLEVMKKQNLLPIFVYASSSSIYGLTKDIPFTETDRADAPASLYAATKRSTELLVHVYHHLYGLSVTGLRFFTVYGPWGRPDMSYMTFTKNIMAGNAIRIFQGPHEAEMSRDFTYVDDIVDGVYAALMTSKPSVIGEAEYRIFNLGNTRPVSVGNFVKVLSSHLNRTANLAYKPLPALGEVMLTHANVTLAQDDLLYAPKTTLVDGLKTFVDWYIGYYGADGHEMKVDEQLYRPD